jgi:predicted transcriptional regulator
MSEEERSEFNQIITVLGNHIRRRIIRKLSDGSDYALRMAQELEIGQQLASKHLNVIQDAQLVDISLKKSDRGAKKKMYALNKYYSLRIDFAPNLYNESLISFSHPNEWIKNSPDLEEIVENLEDQMDESLSIKRINSLNQILFKIDKEIESLDTKRTRLLYLRNLAMKKTSRLLEKKKRHERQIIKYIINNGPTTVANLSKYLNLREEIIRNTLKTLKHEHLIRDVGGKVQIAQ